VIRLEPTLAGHLGPRRRPRSEDAEVQNQVDARPRHQHGRPLVLASKYTVLEAGRRLEMNRSVRLTAGMSDPLKR
jgi:hypothetical protein